MRYRIGGNVIFPNLLLNLLRQIRCRTTRYRRLHVSARQPLKRHGRRADTLLDSAAGAVLFLGVLVLFCLRQRFAAQLRMRRFRFLQPFYLTRRPRNICRLAAQLAQRLRHLQTLLLFLFVKYRFYKVRRTRTRRTPFFPCAT
ncbi:hypothetical protein D3C81_1345960 [compost metagenome]